MACELRRLLNNPLFVMDTNPRFHGASLLARLGAAPPGLGANFLWFLFPANPLPRIAVFRSQPFWLAIWFR